MRWSALLALVLSCACNADGGGGGGGGDDAPDPEPPFEPAITQVVFEIDYERGSEPYTGPILGFGDTFDVMVANTNRLFANAKPVTIPRTLAEMQDIGAIDDEELTASDLLSIADAHRDQRDGGGVKAYYIVFVSGHFADASGPKPSVLGVSLGGTGVIALFKDVIRSTDIPAFPNVVRYVEQSTMVHEGAHAIGLVDNGIPPTSAHVDTPHGAHCTNDRCVMYWLNEGATEATQFALQHVLTNNSILFDAACLADVDALTGGP